jgi:signal transduction histidine kinase
MMSDQKFPEIAKALRERSVTVLERWEAECREKLPDADELTLTQLRDHLPLVIDDIIERLQSDPMDPAGQLDQSYRLHGEKRFQQKYQIDELVAEFEILRKIATEEVLGALKRGMSPGEAVALHAGIDRALRRSVLAYVQFLSSQLKATDDLQSHYVSFLNHDLRGGMNGILLMVEVLKRELSSDTRFVEVRDDLDAMRRAVLDSVATMDRFVFAHRLSRGKYQPRFAPFAPRLVLNDLISHLAHSGHERGVKFYIEAAEDASVSSDRDLVKLILQNLLMNTVKHSKRGGGAVQITVKRRDAETCVISVGDEGPGIPADQFNGIYTLNLDEPGQGRKAVKLGLPVAKMAAELTGGKLSGQSSAGGGSTFTLEIPDRKG